MGWNQIADYPIPAESAEAVEDSNGDLIGVGGVTEGANLTDRCFRYRNGSWNEIASLNTERELFTAAQGPLGNPIVIGGRGSGGKIKRVERFDGTSWNYIEDYPYPVAKAAAFNSFDGNLHVVGGEPAGQRRPTTDHFVYDGNGWIEAEPMNRRRDGFGVVKGPNGNYIATGTGTSFSETEEPESWDGNSWNLLDKLYGQNRAGYIRSPTGNVLVVAGITSFVEEKDVKLFDGSSWKNAEDYPIAVQLPAGSSFSNGNPIVFGGANFGTVGRTNKAYQYIPPEPPTAPTGLTVNTQ